MTYDDFQRNIGKAGLRLNEFAALMQMSPASVSNYRKAGTVPQHLAVIALLLGEMTDRGIDCREVLAKMELKPKKPRGAGIGKFGGDTE